MPKHGAGTLLSPSAISQQSNQTDFRPRNTNTSPSRFQRWVSNWRSILYNFTLTVFILILAVLLTASAFGLGEQAWYSGGQRRWNIVLIIAAYVITGLIAVVHFWSRLLTNKRILKTMPKPYVPTKRLDVDDSVTKHISTEYSRTAVIAHISQATTGTQEGWGRPGSKWADKHFRTEILSTLPEMLDIFNLSNTKTPPLKLDPILSAAIATKDNGLLVFVNSYINMIEEARYSRREPNEVNAEAVMKIMDIIRHTMEARRIRLRGDGTET